MKRGTKCIAQTINLSNPKTCVRPKVQRLVNADPHFNSDRVTDYWIARPVAVKVCSRKDMQQKCPLKLKIHAACPVETPLSSGQRLCGIAMFFLKGAIAASLVYWTCTEGLWGDSSEAEDLYCRIISAHNTALQVQLPHLEGIRYSMSEAYNRALVRCMDIIVGVPLELHRKLRDLLFPCDDVTGGTEEAEEREAHLTS
ncbi:uncharacterized protein LOC114945575 [Nylanderia fulva]|uniref:uncharacterized protein LOC114945575 n=1 Tax=Nylanderia fulva TaxID=613905 RepID=UPI0010FAF3CF|nr:uncharacterized protein LOC114945575 [Nylanderia fulva]